MGKYNQFKRKYYLCNKKRYKDNSIVAFNKEIFFGEAGALIGAPTFAYLASKFSEVSEVVSGFAVVGAILGASIFWLSIRVYHKAKRTDFSSRKFLTDLAYFTPVAILLTLIIYYPALFFLSNNFLVYKNEVVSSVLVSQLVAFLLFLFAINVYRFILIRFFGKTL